MSVRNVTPTFICLVLCATARLHAAADADLNIYFQAVNERGASEVNDTVRDRVTKISGLLSALAITAQSYMIVDSFEGLGLANNMYPIANHQNTEVWVQPLWTDPESKRLGWFREKLPLLKAKVLGVQAGNSYLRSFAYPLFGDATAADVNAALNAAPWIDWPRGRVDPGLNSGAGAKVAKTGVWKYLTGQGFVYDHQELSAYQQKLDFAIDSPQVTGKLQLYLATVNQGTYATSGSPCTADGKWHKWKQITLGGHYVDTLYDAQWIVTPPANMTAPTGVVSPVNGGLYTGGIQIAGWYLVNPDGFFVLDGILPLMVPKFQYWPQADGSNLTDLVGPTSPDKPKCEECPESSSLATPPSNPTTPASTTTTDPVRYADGTGIMYEDDLSMGNDDTFSFRRSYNNLIGNGPGEMGGSWSNDAMPRVVNRNSSLMVRTDAHKQEAYNQQAGNTYTPVRASRKTLIVSSSGDIVFADPAGTTMVFHGFGAGVPTRQQGRLKRWYTSGAIATSTAYDAAGVAQTQTRMTTAAGRSECIQFGYDDAGMLISAERQRFNVVGDAPTVVLRAAYTYDAYSGQLRTATISNGSGAVLRRFAYRYYTETEPGSSIAMLKLAVGPRNYERLLAANIDPAKYSVTDSQVLPYADKVFQYDASRRITQQILRTPDVDGSGTYTYAYTPRSSPPATPGPNDWLMQTLETQPDGSVNTVFTNQAGDVLFRQTATSAGVVVAVDAYQYGTNWQVTHHITGAALQAVSGAWYSTGNTDLIGMQAGNSPYVRDTSGLIERWSYYTTTGSGAATDYLQSRMVQQGELGTPTLLKSYTYTARTTP